MCWSSVPVASDDAIWVAVERPRTGNTVGTAEKALSVQISLSCWIIFLVFVALSSCSSASEEAHTSGGIISRETRTKSFGDVLFDLEFAITQRNFRITGRNDIGGGIRERGAKDFPPAMIVHFCNLTYAREVLELDPLFITHMPCRIAVYIHGDSVVASTTLLPEDSGDPRINAFARKINAMLRQILRFSVE
jgi:uncharacterized protein (DUF302 family)